MEQIVLVPNVLSEEQCSLLIKDANFLTTENNAGAYNYGDYNNLERRRMNDHPIVQSVINKFSLKVENCPVIWYPKGTSNTLHADNSVIENEIVVKVTEWTHSAIIFLNDNFNGGELIYPDQGLTVKPKIGTMVVAPAGHEYMHYVTAVDSDRYVLVLRII